MAALKAPNNLWYGTTGPIDASVVAIGESWGLEELAESKPFVGQSGQEFDRMLHDAGLNRSEILCTNVVNKRPPKNELGRLFAPYSKEAFTHRGLNPTPAIMSELSRLRDQLTRFPRTLIIALGNWSLWSMSDTCGIQLKKYEGYGSVREPTGIISWRSSQIYTTTLPQRTKLLPIIHPAAILREWKWRQTTVQDLRRVHNVKDWEPKRIDIRIPQSYNEIEEWFAPILARVAKGEKIALANDIETFKRRFISVIGFGYGGFNVKGSAMVIPFIKATGPSGAREFSSWWEPKTEARILRLLRHILTHPNIGIEGQNYLYDIQYIIKWLGIEPRCDFDTMLAQHLLFPGVPKSLDFLSSLYCFYHRYWKEDGKDWDLKGDVMQFLLYNGEDCLRTAECATVLRRLITEMGMEEQWENEKRKYQLALRMMQKGIKIDLALRTKLRGDMMREQVRIHSRLAGLIPATIIPHMKTSKVPWYVSVHQQKVLFYEVMGLRPQSHRKTGRATINDEAINALSEDYPELNTLWKHLQAERSVGVFRANFLDAEVDADEHMRCFFNPAGPETFRWSSSENVFGSGTNLQNIPTGDEE